MDRHIVNGVLGGDLTHDEFRALERAVELAITRFGSQSCECRHLNVFLTAGNRKGSRKLRQILEHTKQKPVVAMEKFLIRFGLLQNYEYKHVITTLWTSNKLSTVESEFAFFF